MPRVYAPKRYVRRADWSALSQSVERSLRCGEVGFGCGEQVTGFLHQVRGSAVDVAVVGELAFEAPDLLALCLLYTSPSPRDATLSRMPSSA